MKVKDRKYIPSDYLRIRKFLVSTYQMFNGPYNWNIDTWNFCPYFSLIWQSFDRSHWEDTIRLWEDEAGEIIAIVNSNGIKANQVYFQMRDPNLDLNILEKMFDHAENALKIIIDGKPQIHLWIPEVDKRRESLAASRGYIKQEWNEVGTVISLTTLPAKSIPQGFAIKTNNELDNDEKGQAFTKAFFGINDDQKTFSSAYQLLRQAPDYQPELDLSLVDGNGAITSFCTAWFEPENQIGMLEPVGTHPDYRRMGLGRAVIIEALHRLAQKGAKKVYVASDKDFYYAIGFTRACGNNMWFKML